MNHANQGANYNPSSILPAKRKRGRPRKEHRAETAFVPPGFEGVKRTQTHVVGPLNSSHDDMVGQAVTGTVEAAFDDCYLINIRIGNSNTSLRGIVFKPGHCVPVNAENDVAPNVQMLRRNEVQMRLHGIDRVSKFASQSTNMAVSKGKVSSLVASPLVPPVGARGTVVPVVLQPVNLANGLHSPNQAPSPVAQVHRMPFNEKLVSVVPLAVRSPDGSTPIEQEAGTPADQSRPSQQQTTDQAKCEVIQNENESFKPRISESIQGEQVMPTELIPNVVQDSSELSAPRETSILAASIAEDSSGATSVRYVGEINETLSIEPLQTLHADLHSGFSTVSRPLEDIKTGRMTELLQAVQESARNYHRSRAETFAIDAVAELGKPNSLETNIGDKESHPLIPGV